MNAVNASLIMIALVAGFVITTFSTMIENARKAFKDFHMADFEQILRAGDVAANNQQIITGITNILERHYHHNRVMLLKHARVFLSALIIASLFLWLVGYFFGVLFIPKVTANLNHNAQSVIDEFTIVSHIPFYAILAVSGVALLLNSLVAIHYDLPYYVLKYARPTRIEVKPSNETAE